MNKKKIAAAGVESLKKAGRQKKKNQPESQINYRCFHIKELLKIILRLRDKKKGCAWDLQQTVESLKNSLIEEVYELAQAIESGEKNKISEELGDILFVNLMMMHIAEQDNIIDFNKSIETISQKLIRRHPHIFGNLKVDSSDEILKNWEKIKRAEKKNNDTYSVLIDIPRSMPSLLRINRMFNKLDRLGELSMIKKNKTMSNINENKPRNINKEDCEKNKIEKKFREEIYKITLSAYKKKINLEDILHKIIDNEIQKKR